MKIQNLQKKILKFCKKTIKIDIFQVNKKLKKSSFKSLIFIDYQRLFNEFYDFDFINYIKNAIINFSKKIKI